MAERLAVKARPEHDAPVSPEQQAFDDAFNNIVRKDDQKEFDNIVAGIDLAGPSGNVGEVMDAQGAAPLSEFESKALADLEGHFDDDLDMTQAHPQAIKTVAIPTRISASGSGTMPTPTITPPSLTTGTSPITTSSTTTPPPTPPSTPPPTTHLPPPNAAPPTPEFKIVLVDQTEDAKDAAKAAAQAWLDRDLSEGGRLRRLGKSIWKGNLFKDYYLRRETLRAGREITEAQDVLIHTESSADARARATQAVLERFGYTEFEETIHRRAGEDRREMEANSRATLEAKELIRRYVNGELNDDVFAERRREFAAHHSGEVSMDNLFEIAQSVKGIVEHGESLENALQNMKIITGEVRAGARTQAEHNWSDRILDKLGRSKLGSLVSEEFLAGAVSIATSLVRIGTTKATAAAATTLAVVSGVGVIVAVAGGVGVAATAGIGVLRERKRLADERAQHTREMAMGGEVSQGSAPQGLRQRMIRRLLPNRRAQLEEARITENTATAGELTQGLRAQMDTLALDDANLPPGMTREEAVREAIAVLAASEARNYTTDTTRNEVLTWGGDAAARNERLQFDLARAQLKVMLRNQIDEATRQQLATAFTNDASSSLEQIIDQQGVRLIEAIEAEATTRDRAFRKLRRKRMVLVGGLILVGGLTIGSALQEGAALASSTRVGVADSAFGMENQLADGVERQTLIRGMSNGETGPSHVGHSEVFSNLDVGEKNITWSITDDHKMVQNTDGTYNLVDRNGGVTIENFKVNPDGTMPEETATLLESKGMDVAPDNKVIPGEVTAQQVTPQEHLANHVDQAPAVQVDDWMTNDTEAPVFDKNEHGLHWTGTGYVTEASGNNSYHLNVSNMTEGGSYRNGESINWVEEAQKGTLTLRISPIENSLQAFIIPVAPDGSIDIPADHPAAQYLSVKNGQASFDGFEAKVARLNDVDANGTHHVDVLATLVGTGEAEGRTVQDFIKGPDTIQPGYKIVTNGYDVAGITTELPPFVPIRGRRGLEILKPRPSRPNPEYSPNNYIGGGASPEWAKQMVEDRIPELRRNPNARISLGDGLRWHHDLLRRKDPEYADKIDALVDTMPNLANLDSKTNTIVPILVGANFEHDNIYRTLSLYARMPDSWQEKTQLILHVNWIDAKENDPVEKAKIEKTKSEIARAIRDFPTLQISQFESVWSQEKIDKGEYGDRLIAHAAQQLVDVSMAATRKAIEAGRISEDYDILLWKGDADAQGMNRYAGPNMTKAFLSHPEADAFSGGVRWGTERHKKLPGLGFVVNFMEVYRIAAQRAHIKGFQSTFGVNGGARMSTFAAIGGIGHYTNQDQSPPDDGWGDRLFAARNPGVGGTSSSYGASGGRTGVNNDYHLHVGGASIDTDASRFEKVYTSGEPITSIWANVNSNGYQGRTNGLRSGQKEDLRRDPDEVMARVEYHMSDLISHWTAEPAQVATALAIMLPGTKELKGARAYTITRNPKGESEFKLTPQGRKWLISRLQYNSKGQFDPYGDRQARQLYGRTRKRGSGSTRWSIPTAQRQSRMIAGVV